MRALIIGYGSMGRRRIRILKSLYPDTDFACLDTNVERKQQIASDGLKPYNNLSDALEFKPDIAFVCTSPGVIHAELILELVKAKIDTFTELNLTSEYYDAIIQQAKNNGVHVFMSSTMLYDRQIIKICELIRKANEPLTYIYHVGQYLPDWHPWESYKNFFIGRKETNGCREIFAIQLPWLIEAFGKVNEFKVISGCNTSLDIDYNDNYIVSFSHKNNNRGVFIVDVVARMATTYLEVMGEHLHIFWKGTPDSLMIFDIDSKRMRNIDTYSDYEHIDGYADMVTEDEYKDEIVAFLDWVRNDNKPRYTLEDDKYTLSIIDKIEGKE